MNVQAEFDPQSTHKKPDIMALPSGPSTRRQKKGILGLMG